MEERLQKYLANSGVCSRRKAEELILAGKVKVNGKVIKELGTKINPEKDKIEYNGKVIKENKRKVYILLNKPVGYVTTMNEQFGRDSILDLLKGVEDRVVPAGRLDMYTSGALILSNDGDFINKVTHPKHEVEKTYNVTLHGIVTSEDVERLREGVIIDNNGQEFKTGKAIVKILKTDEVKNQSRLQITIHEGKNREVRKMIGAIDKKVIALHRARIGNLDVKNLKLGTWRNLTLKEVQNLIKD